MRQVAASDHNAAVDVREDVSPAPRMRRGVRIGLSGKLLLLTVLFVMLAEVLIYVPSIANFRINWLNDRLAAAHTAALVLQAAPRESNSGRCGPRNARRASAPA